MVIGFWMTVIAMWLFSDAIYSITLYLNAPSYDGSARQTWRRDHWVRIVRGIASLVLLYFGFRLLQ
jgi:threonine/homoserine/homoserine lactone efflux protein